MKKIHSKYSSIILAILAGLIAVPIITKAENRPSVLPMLRNAVKERVEDAGNNEAIRNKILDKVASTTREQRAEIENERRIEAQGTRRENRNDIRNASTSEDRREIRQSMHRDEFEVRKAAVVRQLNLALNNLKQIRERISSRIDKATASGRAMSDAKDLLVIADNKMALAEQDINSVFVVQPFPTPAATTTDNVELNKPRKVADNAIAAIKTAREALVEVVRAIAHSMGLGNATSTPEIIPPTSTTTATTTATTTDTTTST